MMRRLFRDAGAAATIEFALLVPILMYLGGAGIEYSYYGLAQLKISQIALELADNASRVGLSSTLSSVQLRETDVNDILTGARMQGTGINLTPNGRSSSPVWKMSSNPMTPARFSASTGNAAWE
jgi:Flp pilus assembly protein TadG